MGFFNKILDKLGMGHADATTTDTAKTSSTSATAQPDTPSNPAESTPNVTHEAAAQPVSQVDVVTQLEQRAAASTQKLNWKTSIVDLLKLLDIDSSLAARKELAAELGCPVDLMQDSTKMNMWLHKAVLARIAENGGNVPHELLN